MNPIIERPSNSQNYNRYSYCLNNPLKYVDPSGHVALNPWYEYMAGPKKFLTWMPEDMSFYDDNLGRRWKNIGETVDTKGFYGDETGMWIYKNFENYSEIIALFNNFSEKQSILQDNLSQSNNFKFTAGAGTLRIEGEGIGRMFTNEKGEWYDKKAVYFTGAILTAEDVYNNYYHNHSTYTTNKGVVKPIYKANGKVRSLRASQFAKNSLSVKVLGTIGSAFMTAQAATKIYNGNATAWDYGDFTVGSVGTVAGATELIGGAKFAIPGIGQSVAAYGWLRLWYDLGANYGPSRWYGNNDNKYLE